MNELLEERIRDRTKVLRNEVEMVYEDTSLWGLLFKVGIYTLLGTIAVLYMHNSKLKSSYEKIDEDSAVSKTVHATLAPPGSVGGYEKPVEKLMSGAFQESTDKTVISEPPTEPDVKKIE